MPRSAPLPRAFLPFLVAIFVLLPATQAAAVQTTFYLRPDSNLDQAPGTSPWSVVGAAAAWSALDDGVTESQTPTATDYIQGSGSKETRIGLGSAAITGATVKKATIYVYSNTAETFEFKSTADSTWQSASSVGWHSRSQTIASQAALDGLGIYFRKKTEKSSQVLAAFLKIETSGPHVCWGAWMDGDVYETPEEPELGDAPWDSSTWDKFEEHAGKSVSIVHFGQPTPWEQSFAASPLEKARTRGALPLMDMGTGYKLGKTPKANESLEEEETNKASLTEIKEGVYDSYFEEWAEDVAAYEYPLFFRWAWEMNGDWFKWGRDAEASPTTFKEAWQHVHGIAETANADNLTWVWCPNVETGETTSIKSLYPGDAYVDWTCLDGYNREIQSFTEVFGSTYSLLTTEVASSKPVMIGETASLETEADGKPTEFKANWIQTALSSLPSSFPKIEAFVWFNWNIVEEGEERTWPIESSESAQKAFATRIASPFFAEDEFGSPEKLKPIQPLP